MIDCEFCGGTSDVDSVYTTINTRVHRLPLCESCRDDAVARLVEATRTVTDEEPAAFDVARTVLTDSRRGAQTDSLSPTVAVEALQDAGFDADRRREILEVYADV